VAVIGAGGIGGVVAAAADTSGHDVIVCVRRPIDRLIVTSRGVPREIPAEIVSSPEGISDRADQVWITTKVGDTTSAKPWLAPLCGPSTLVVVAQNGLDHEARVAPLAPEGAVIVPALAYLASERIAPGQVVHHGGRRVVVPAAPEADRVAEAVAGELKVETTEDFVTASWRKLFGNLIVNPITALTLRRVDIMNDPGISLLARRMLEEAAEVGRAEGAKLTGEHVDEAISRMHSYGAGPGSSMLYDRLAGLPLEYDDLTGEVVRRAQAHGIPAPFNETILALVAALGPLPAGR
jgi:2-dehydropantoate 2-reductase